MALLSRYREMTSSNSIVASLPSLLILTFAVLPRKAPFKPYIAVILYIYPIHVHPSKHPTPNRDSQHHFRNYASQHPIQNNAYWRLIRNDTLQNLTCIMPPGTPFTGSSFLLNWGFCCDAWINKQLGLPSQLYFQTIFLLLKTCCVFYKALLRRRHRGEWEKIITSN
jgi:hypothetical protein